MAFILKTGTKVRLTVSGVDAEGNVAPIDASAPIGATSSDPSMLTVENDPNDNASVIVTDVDGAGTGEVTITFTGDGDAGEGIVPISADFVIELQAGDAVGLTVVAGEPEPR